jgi:hypothetical protein
MIHKQKVRHTLVRAIEGVEKQPDLTLRRNALGAILDIVSEFQESLRLDIGGLTALIEINKNNKEQNNGSN